ncbi:hypothetical protein EJ04DRAFT_576734 [Polyplosphaeria fusca]|uniref:Uncharacterized protein n=1 Tax=Polyplosphaeria fusca TaxID=682080 RepID=A0A9P4UZU8_9PLEO|nr:hypothetical protein EJ04DRAFT_576734 [Polyplosphaeria fusca]
MLLDVDIHHPDVCVDKHGGDAIQLHEGVIGGPYHSHPITEQLVEDYVANDYQAAPGVPNAGQNTTPPSNVESLKLFFSTRQGEYDGKKLPLPISPDLFAQLAPYARIPKIYPTILHRNTASAIFSVPEVPPIEQPTLSPTNISKEHLSFIINDANSSPARIHMCASFTMHIPTQRLYIFMHGLDTPLYHSIPTLLPSLSPTTTFLLLPALLLRTNMLHHTTMIESNVHRLLPYERLLGLRFSSHAPSPPANHTAIDYDLITNLVNATQTDLAFLTWQCKTIARQLDFLDAVAARYREMCVQHGEAGRGARVFAILSATHAELRAWNEGQMDRIEYVVKRGQGLVQVVYSGIAQRDAAHNLKIASTSTRLAESSQAIAVATSRDSAVMRVIAAITIFFLPATFTATFFSTSFFDFKVGRYERVVSWWIWLYFLTTMLLTVVVVAGTYVMWKRKEAEIALRVRDPASGGKAVDVTSK